MERLNHDLWFIVAVYLDLESIRNLSGAFRYFWEEVVNGIPEFWKKLVLRKLNMVDPQVPFDWRNFYLTLANSAQDQSQLFDPVSWNTLRYFSPICEYEYIGDMARICSMWLETPLRYSTHPHTTSVPPGDVIANYGGHINSLFQLPRLIREGPWIVEHITDHCLYCSGNCGEFTDLLFFTSCFHWPRDNADYLLNDECNFETEGKGLFMTERHRIEENGVSLNVLRNIAEAGDNEEVRHISRALEAVSFEGILSPRGCRFTLDKGPGEMEFKFYLSEAIEGHTVHMYVSIARVH